MLIYTVIKVTEYRDGKNFVEFYCTSIPDMDVTTHRVEIGDQGLHQLVSLEGLKCQHLESNPDGALRVWVR